MRGHAFKPKSTRHFRGWEFVGACGCGWIDPTRDPLTKAGAKQRHAEHITEVLAALKAAYPKGGKR